MGEFVEGVGLFSKNAAFRRKNAAFSVRGVVL